MFAVPYTGGRDARGPTKALEPGNVTINGNMTNSKSRRSTKPRLSAFAAQLLEQWRRLALPTSEAAIVIAVSGGADSTALLLAMNELIKADTLRLNLTVGHL